MLIRFKFIFFNFKKTFLHTKCSLFRRTTTWCGKIIRLFKQQFYVYNDLVDEWQQRWDEYSKVRHLCQFFPYVRERLSRTWLEVDHCVNQFLTGHSNFKSKLHSFKLVDSTLCQCSTRDSRCGNVVLGTMNVIKCQITYKLHFGRLTMGILYQLGWISVRLGHSAML